MAVAAGIADVAVGLRSAAHELALDLVSLPWEPYDVALPAGALGAVRPVITAPNSLKGYHMTFWGQSPGARGGQRSWV